MLAFNSRLVSLVNDCTLALTLRYAIQELMKASISTWGGGRLGNGG